nr:PREDICTED: interleukin-1 receptor-associated kinase 3 [Latimeria chalumnae]|eukprot:XP_014340201.1 PREDICTED: interleukin-1 receptor-associated kinase 3 [Latimeria chalumnae]
MELRAGLTWATCLFDVSAAVMEKFCRLMDSSDGDLGWRGLAEHISADWLEFRNVQEHATRGKSRTGELLWSWAQKNKTVGDLLLILQEMDHQRAMSIFTQEGKSLPASHGSDYKRTTQQLSMNFRNIIEGTRDFHRDLMIGEGTFFEVYKAEIHNQTFAVKLLKQVRKWDWNKQWKHFLSETEVLLLFHHPNILDLTGCFSENGKFCLVYPYMKNGSLLDCLHCLNNHAPLPWLTRLNILVGIANGVQHLHRAQPCSVVCGNITSANILLDEHFEPKLSDFGMAYQRPQTVTHSYSINMDADTLKIMGYLPEEYFRQGKLSVQVDVYSYGVVIMEVLTGKRAVIETPKHLQLRDLVTEMIEQSGVIDSCLSLLDRKAGFWPHGITLRLFQVAVQCTSSRPKMRPAMATVFEILRDFKQILHFQEDQPQSLKSFLPASLATCQFPSIPVENDEIHGFPLNYLGVSSSKGPHSDMHARLRKLPCECSQSEVTFLGVDGGAGAQGRVRVGARTPQAALKDEDPTVPSDRSTAPWRCGNANNMLVSSLSDSPVHASVVSPVECSCSVDNVGNACEECLANGLKVSELQKSNEEGKK